MNNIKILIADDHHLMRESIKSILSKVDNFFVDTAVNGLEVLQKLEIMKPDLVLMDIRMPLLDGIQATKQIKQKQPNVKIIIISALKENEYIIESLKAGANGYLFKDTITEYLIKAIQQVFNGKYYIDENISQELIKDYLSKI